jgi:hypothetical protein
VVAPAVFDGCRWGGQRLGLEETMGNPFEVEEGSAGAHLGLSMVMWIGRKGIDGGRLVHWAMKLAVGLVSSVAQRHNWWRRLRAWRVTGGGWHRWGVMAEGKFDVGRHRGSRWLLGMVQLDPKMTPTRAKMATLGRSSVGHGGSSSRRQCSTQGGAKQRCPMVRWSEEPVRRGKRTLPRRRSG